MQYRRILTMRCFTSTQAITKFSSLRSYAACDSGYIKGIEVLSHTNQRDLYKNGLLIIWDEMILYFWVRGQHVES